MNELLLLLRKWIAVSEANVVLSTILWSLRGFLCRFMSPGLTSLKNVWTSFCDSTFSGHWAFFTCHTGLAFLWPYFHQVKFVKSQLPVRRESWWNKYATNRHVGMEVWQWNCSASVLQYFNRLFVKFLKFGWNTKHFSVFTANFICCCVFLNPQHAAVLCL